MAQDPESDEGQPEEGEGPLDPSHDLDMATLYSSSTFDAELEAEVIRSLLESNGIPAMVVSGSPFASLAYEVQVPRSRAEEAERVIQEAEVAGEDAAFEAEAASEGTQEPTSGS